MISCKLRKINKVKLIRKVYVTCDCVVYILLGNYEAERYCVLSPADSQVTVVNIEARSQCEVRQHSLVKH